MVGQYALIGASGAVIIIAVTVTGVVIKRVTENTGMDFDKTSRKVELIRDKLFV